MSFIILYWNLPSDVAIMTEEDGTPMLFVMRKKAVAFAKELCAWEWDIIEIN